MSQIFLTVFNLSIAACWLIAAVLLVRLAFGKRMPKWISCCLWGLVAVRLLIPFTWESNLSLVPNSRLEITAEQQITEQSGADWQKNEQQGSESGYISEISGGESIDNSLPVFENSEPFGQIGEASEGNTENIGGVSNVIVDTEASAPALNENELILPENQPITEAVVKQENEIKGISPKTAGTLGIVWLCGAVAMLIYSFVTYILLKRRVMLSIPCGDKVRKGECVESPFVFGLFRPRIYIPFGLSAETEKCVIAHERAHLKRNDHLVKPLGFLILSVYWFNPLVWVAYILLCRDIEYACDEKVINDLPHEERKAYAYALLECAVAHKRISACPVAFGETGVKERVENTMKYKKPAFWISLVSIFLCAMVAALFLTTSAGENNEPSAESVAEQSSEESQALLRNPEELEYIDNLFAVLPIEDDIEKYSGCYRYESDDHSVMPILFVPKTVLYDIRVYSLDLADDWVESGNMIIENILFEAERITDTKPLLADIQLVDAFAVRGISFTDENGNEHFYKISDSAIDGSPIVSEFKTQKGEESTLPEENEPETSEPETSEPETSEPEENEPETSEPEVNEPEVNEPETSEPEQNAPQSNGKVNVVGKTLGAGGASQGDWIYYVEGNQFFKINQNTYKSETIFILPTGWASNLNVVGDWLYFSVPETTDESAYIGKVRTDGRDFQKIVYTNDVWEVLVIGETVYYTSTNNPYTVWAKDVAPLYSVSVNGGAVTQVHDGSVENLVADENYIYFQYREKDGGKRSFVRMNHNATSRQTLWINELAGTEIDSFGFVVSEGRIYFAERYDNSETYRTVSSISINGGDYVAHFRANLCSSSLWAKNGKIYFSGVAPEYRDGYIGEYGDLGLTEYDMASGRFTALSGRFTALYDECQYFYPTNEMLVVPEMHALWLYDYDSKTFTKVLLYV